MRKFLPIISLFTALLILVSGIAIVPAQADEGSRASNPYLVETVVDDEGRELDIIIVPGRPPEIKAAAVSLPEPNPAAGINTLPNVPAFDWSYGCSATSAAMMMGYYDNSGYANMYAGPTNGGACPMDNYSTWGSGECPLSATHKGEDGLKTKGHVDDYWSSSDSINDPYYDHWTEHGYADCTADFMGTNQYHNWQNTNGSTTFYFASDGSPLYDYSGMELSYRRDGCHGIKLFVESRGYQVFHDGVYYQNYNQYISPYKTAGFTFNQYKAEIDAGRPVLIQVEGHTMLGYGYDDTGQTVYLHDTWDYENHFMTWGGDYEGLPHYGVTVIVLEEESDLGDAPDDSTSPIYPTLLVNNGACHNIVPGFYLGSLIDSEPDGQPNAHASGDDLLDGNDDEDGVVFTSVLIPGQQATLTATASLAGKLDAWLDFNSDGDWADAGEQIFTSLSLSAGANALSFPVPGGAVLGQTFARFRYSSAGGLPYDGPAPDGEVEDYQVLVIEEGAGIPVWGIVRQVDCNPLDGALVELLYEDAVITSAPTDTDGFYTLYAPSAGDYELRASKAEFRTESQPVTVDTSTVALDFCGEHGLVPNAPDVFYVMACIGCWQFPENQTIPCCGLDVFRVMTVVGAWQFPV